MSRQIIDSKIAICFLAGFLFSCKTFDAFVEVPTTKEIVLHSEEITYFIPKQDEWNELETFSEIKNYKHKYSEMVIYIESHNSNNVSDIIKKYKEVFFGMHILFETVIPLENKIVHTISWLTGGDKKVIVLFIQSNKYDKVYTVDCWAPRDNKFFWENCVGFASKINYK